jgi:hypothetical protein
VLPATRFDNKSGTAEQEHWLGISSAGGSDAVDDRSWSAQLRSAAGQWAWSPSRASGLPEAAGPLRRRRAAVPSAQLLRSPHATAPAHQRYPLPPWETQRGLPADPTPSPSLTPARRGRAPSQSIDRPKAVLRNATGRYRCSLRCAPQRRSEGAAKSGWQRRVRAAALGLAAWIHGFRHVRWLRCPDADHGHYCKTRVVVHREVLCN